MLLFGPSKKPRDFGFKPGDFHLVANDQSETMKCFSFDGKKLWELPCLAKGVGGEDWNRWKGDTPPGLYKLGQIWNDYATGNRSTAYGWITFDMVSLDGGEEGAGRDGICLHGGGSGLGWDGSWEPYQDLIPTYGCLRMHNQDLRDKVLPLVSPTNTVYVSVWQD